MTAPSLHDRRWLYQVPIVNKKTGERRMVIIELTEFQRRQCVEYEAFYPNHTGGDRGPIARKYALDQADKKTPPGFIPVCDGIERVPLPNLRIVA
jgi:hypothetical protein